VGFKYPVRSNRRREGFPLDRRRLLLLVVVVAVVATAGCLGGGDGPAEAGDGGGQGDDGGEGDGSGESDPYGFYDGAGEPTGTSSAARTYVNETLGFQMTIPGDWEQVGDTPLWYPGPDPGVSEPRRNLNVAVEVVGDMTRSEYVDRATANVKRIMDAENVSAEAAVLGGDQASRLSYDGTFRGLKLTWIQLVAVHGDHAYAVSYVFPQGEEPGHEAELDRVLSSFAFLEGAGDASAGSGNVSEPTSGV
jgi:hypothetical protein